MRNYLHMRSFILLALLLLPFAAFGQEDLVFTPLTGLPGVGELSNQDSLAAFLNTLYKLCVGVAATLAVVQIMRAGFLWMKGDSVTGSKEARSLIQMALLGLLLVLSPAIVFGIIDPRILNLSLDVSSLKLDAPTALPQSGTQDPNQTGTPTQLENTCVNPSYQTSIESALASFRLTNPRGEANLDITSLGQAGIGCCAAVSDADGSKCQGRTSQSFTQSGSLNYSYSCICNGGISQSSTIQWTLSETTIRVDLRNTSAPQNIRNSVPYNFVPGGSATIQEYQTQQECEGATLTQQNIHNNIKNNVYVCPSSGGGFCPQVVSWLKGQTSLPTGVLSVQDRTCSQ